MGVEPQILVRRGLLVVAALSVVTGVLAGLARMGLPTAVGVAQAVGHGPLLVLGAFCLIISLERAVALGENWGLAAPAAACAGSISLWFDVPGSRWVLVLAVLLLSAVNAAIVRRQAAVFTWLMSFGGLVFAAGTIAWALGAPLHALVPTWLAFFVLTIVAERIELSRLVVMPPGARWGIVVLSLLLGGFSVAPLLGAPELVRGFGASLIGVGAWQLRYDVASRLVRTKGLPRFVAVGVLAGAAWLLVGGAVLVLFGLPAAGPIYDAALHCVFVGYVLSMVFAHAPIILPAVARVSVPYTSLLYAPLALLHGGLVARVAGDLALVLSLRQFGSLASALALALFAVVVIAGRWRAARGKPEKARA